MSRGLSTFRADEKGPFYYDVASFLWQAKAKYPDSLRQELLKEYIDALRKYQPIDEPYFYSQLRHFVLFRTLQVLGAYGFRGYFEKKPHFIQSVPFAIQNLRDLLKRRTLNTRIFAMCYANLPNSSNSPTISRNGSLPSK